MRKPDVGGKFHHCVDSNLRKFSSIAPTRLKPSNFSVMRPFLRYWLAKSSSNTKAYNYQPICLSMSCNTVKKSAGRLLLNHNNCFGRFIETLIVDTDSFKRAIIKSSKNMFSMCCCIDLSQSTDWFWQGSVGCVSHSIVVSLISLRRQHSVVCRCCIL